MSRIVLIDTSVWIEVSGGGGDEVLQAEGVTLLTGGRAAMSWPGWVELHQGARGQRGEKE